MATTTTRTGAELANIRRHLVVRSLAAAPTALVGVDRIGGEDDLVNVCPLGFP